MLNREPRTLNPMTPQRLSVKFFVQGDAPVDLAPFTPLFHRWIQNDVVEGLLVDVADYRHVPDGPGILLIGHEVDYGLDLSAGRPGLLVRRKRYQGAASLAEVLRDTLRKAVLAARAIKADGATGVTFDAAAVEITLIDRLTAPNTDQAAAQFKDEIAGVLGDVYEEPFEMRRGSTDSRACLSFIAMAKGPGEFDDLLERLTAAAASA
jgi:hypothetical protein